MASEGYLDFYRFSCISQTGSLVSPKVVKSVHYCPKTKKMSDRRYTDLTSLSAFPSSSVYPTKDDDGNPLETEYGLSVYKDHQTFTIQVKYIITWLNLIVQFIG